MRLFSAPLCLAAFLAFVVNTAAFQRAASLRVKCLTLRKASNQDNDLGGNAASRALFSLTEVFAKVLGTDSDKVSSSTGTMGDASKSLNTVAEAIREEYEALFWVTGNMDTSLWADDCTFADPFSSFGGPGSTQRFKANADSLGKLVLHPKSRVTSFEVTDDYRVNIGWTFSSKLKLPWRPVLAAAGVTRHQLNPETLLIERYEESWKSKPWDVVKRLFVPTKDNDEDDSSDKIGKKLIGTLFIAGSLAGLPEMATATGDMLRASERETIQLFEQSKPSVVYINVYSEKIDVLNMDVMDVPAGTGTGFVWNKNGDIVTNYHVIRRAKKAKVILTPHDGSTPRTYSATVRGVDPDKDIAVLRLVVPDKREKYQPIKIGKSKDLKVGQFTMAVGNPFGLDHTLTSGLISGLGREVRSPTGRPISNVIQTDASINPGNSGGPLLDSSGALIGMNTAIYTLSGASAGIGFAIPVDTLSQVVTTILKDGYVTRPIIGVTYLESSQARLLGIEKGILVLDSPKNSPAGQAGIRGTSRGPDGGLVLGDIIVGVDDAPVNTEADLFKAVQENHQVGDEVTVKVERYTFPDKAAMQENFENRQNEAAHGAIVPEKLSFRVKLIVSPERATANF